MFEVYKIVRLYDFKLVFVLKVWCTDLYIYQLRKSGRYSTVRFQIFIFKQKHESFFGTETFIYFKDQIPQINSNKKSKFTDRNSLLYISELRDLKVNI